MQCAGLPQSAAFMDWRDFPSSGARVRQAVLLPMVNIRKRRRLSSDKRVCRRAPASARSPGPGAPGRPAGVRITFLFSWNRV